MIFDDIQRFYATFSGLSGWKLIEESKYSYQISKMRNLYLYNLHVFVIYLHFDCYIHNKMKSPLLSWTIVLILFVIFTTFHVRRQQKRIVYTCGLNKRISSKFPETIDCDKRYLWAKCYIYMDQDEVSYPSW